MRKPIEDLQGTPTPTSEDPKQPIGNAIGVEKFFERTTRNRDNEMYDIPDPIITGVRVLTVIIMRLLSF